MNARITVLLLTGIFGVSSSLAATIPTYILAKDQSKIEFIAHTKNSSVRGSFSDFKIVAQSSGPKLSDVKVSVAITTASLNTQNSSRDKHLRSEDFLWSDKYPVATFETTKLTQKSDGIFEVEGTLSLRGVTKAIRFETKVEEKRDNPLTTIRLKGEVTLNRMDFGISYQPFFLLPRIKDDVQVAFELVALMKMPTPSS